MKDVCLQDVVFAGGDGVSINSIKAADRASVEKLNELTTVEKKAEKLDMQAVRKGCGVRSRHRCPKRINIKLF